MCKNNFEHLLINSKQKKRVCKDFRFSSAYSLFIYFRRGVFSLYIPSNTHHILKQLSLSRFLFVFFNQLLLQVARNKFVTCKLHDE